MGPMLSPLPDLDLAEFLSVDEQSWRLIFYLIGNARGISCLTERSVRNSNQDKTFEDSRHGLPDHRVCCVRV